MCDPVSASMALAAGGTVMKAYGAFSASQSQASALKANAAADLQQGYANEQDSRDTSRAKLAGQLAALSERGVSLSSGTPLDLMRASARNAEIDALRLRADGQNKSNALKAQASGALKTGWLTAGGQLLSGASQAAGLSQLGGSGGSLAPVVVTPSPVTGRM